MSYISEKYGIPAEAVVKMARDGILDWRINYYYEFWTLYNEILDYNYKNAVPYPRREARKEVMIHFKIRSDRNFYRWLQACKKYFEHKD